MSTRLLLLFSCDKDKQIFYSSLLCIYTIHSKSDLSSQHSSTSQFMTGIREGAINWQVLVGTFCIVNNYQIHYLRLGQTKIISNLIIIKITTYLFLLQATFILLQI